MRQIVIRLLATIEVANGRGDLRIIKPKIIHHLAGRTNILLGDPAIAFGDVPHGFESDAKEILSHRDRITEGSGLLLLQTERIRIFHLVKARAWRFGLPRRGRNISGLFAAGAARTPRALAEFVVDQMACQHAQRRPHRASYQQAERTADEFPAPIHAAILPTPDSNPSTGSITTGKTLEQPPPVPHGAPQTPPTAPLHTSHLQHLPRLHSGKVRDIYDIDHEHMLIVTTDRISAFDVVMPDPIPHKGRVLTEISQFWFERTRGIIDNQLTGRDLRGLPLEPAELTQLTGRSMVVRKLRALPIEAVVRGYLIGSGWKDYQRTGKVCGLALPPGLELAAALPEPLFTPANKAPAGAHDENIDFATVKSLIGEDLALRVRTASLQLYDFASRHARERGLIIADTKFEFGVDAAGNLVLIDEVLTPDSSRFWPADTWRCGISPPSFDKQYLRDYLETLDWNKQAPGPSLPAEIIAHTSEKYLEALRRLTG